MFVVVFFTGPPLLCGNTRPLLVPAANSLLPNCLVRSDAVDSELEHLVRTQGCKTWALKIAAKGSHLSSALMTPSWESVQRAIRGSTKKPDNLFGKRLVFFPLCRYDHWVLAVADLERRTICTYDSLKGSSGAPNPLGLGVKNYLMVRQELLGLSHLGGFSILPDATCPQQENVQDCGIYLCLFARRLASGQQVGRFTPARANLYREEMRARILQHGLLA